MTAEQQFERGIRLLSGMLIKLIAAFDAGTEKEFDPEIFKKEYKDATSEALAFLVFAVKYDESEASNEGDKNVSDV